LVSMKSREVMDSPEIQIRQESKSARRTQMSHSKDSRKLGNRVWLLVQLRKEYEPSEAIHTPSMQIRQDSESRTGFECQLQKSMAVCETGFEKCLK
jgi:hypothetical protein